MGAKRQLGQYPGGDDIFGQDFHEGGKGDGLHLKFRSAVGVFSVLGPPDYFLNSFIIGISTGQKAPVLASKDKL